MLKENSDLTNFKRGDSVRRVDAFGGENQVQMLAPYTVQEAADGYIKVLVGGKTSDWLHRSRFELTPQWSEERIIKAYQTKVTAALQTQVGGSHYTDMPIQPIEYILANSIPFPEGNVIKYVSRWRAKGGVKDLEKAVHHLKLLIEHEGAKKA